MEEPNRFAQDMRIRASFAALRAYAARFLWDDAADACLAQQRAEMLAALDPMRPTGFPSIVYRVAKSKCGVPPNGLAELPTKPGGGANAAPAAVLRLSLAQRFAACETPSGESRASCIDEAIAVRLKAGNAVRK